MVPNRSCASFLSSCDRKAGGLPFGKTVLKAAGLESTAPEFRDGLEGQDAPRSATVGDDVDFAGQVGKPLLEFIQRNVERTRHVPGCELVRRPDVQHRDGAVLQARTQPPPGSLGAGPDCPFENSQTERAGSSLGSLKINDG
jgi:hypothetical protein